MRYARHLWIHDDLPTGGDAEFFKLVKGAVREHPELAELRRPPSERTTKLAAALRAEAHRVHGEVIFAVRPRATSPVCLFWIDPDCEELLLLRAVVPGRLWSNEGVRRVELGIAYERLVPTLRLWGRIR